MKLLDSPLIKYDKLTIVVKNSTKHQFQAIGSFEPPGTIRIEIVDAESRVLIANGDALNVKRN